MEEAATALAQLRGQAEALRASGDEAQATQMESICAAMAQMKAKAVADKQRQEDNDDLAEMDSSPSEASEMAVQDAMRAFKEVIQDVMKPDQVALYAKEHAGVSFEAALMGIFNSAPEPLPGTQRKLEAEGLKDWVQSKLTQEQQEELTIKMEARAMAIKNERMVGPRSHKDYEKRKRIFETVATEEQKAYVAKQQERIQTASCGEREAIIRDIREWKEKNMTAEQIEEMEQLGKEQYHQDTLHQT